MNVKHWRVYCETDSQHETCWNPEQPAGCPINVSHTIDSDSWLILEEIGDEVITVKEEDTPTGGHYGAETIAFDAPGNTVTNYDLTLPMPISLLATNLDAKNKNDGDEIGFDINPETVIGVLDTAIAASATVINLPSSILNFFNLGNLWIGQTLILDDSTNKDDCGAITSFDVGALTVTTTKGTTNAFAIGSSIKITTSMSPQIVSNGWVELESGDNKIYTFGETKIGASYIAAGRVIRIRYRNNSSTQARVVVLLEYLY